ncbi:MAG: aldo/keto reductase [Spirochaetae bacterium HGW-Spirochaetae-1]|jgi:aryl-alcohol dehydrogenase-like predicted oxidoreductase|nr:MAG: aldo/keto reductase [Spirochaetae bacterium HGW-Spirochaetae-1]
MIKRRIGTSSLYSSVLGLGSLHFGVYCDQKLTNDIVSFALDCGINFIDTAPMYGNGKSEQYLHNALKGIKREQIIISTKVGLEPEINSDGSFSVREIKLIKNNIVTSVEQSLRNLGTDYIDLLQLHAFDHTTSFDETLDVLYDLVQNGKIRYIGCSNYNPDEFILAAKTAERKAFSNIVSAQCHFNIIERRARAELFPICKDYNTSIICNRSLARGILTGKYKYGQPLPHGCRAETSYRVRKWLLEDTLLLVNELATYAERFGRSITELSLAWTLIAPEISTILVGVRNIDQLKQCISSVDFSLEDKHLLEIDSIIERMNLTNRVNLLPEVYFEK